MNNKLNIFVSYGHDEYVAYARRVADELKERGHEVWFDEDKLKPGPAWEQYIERGIQKVVESGKEGRMLYIMTPHSTRRPDGFCLNELAKALDNGVSIIPVMLVSVTPPLSIYRLQYLDLSISQAPYLCGDSFMSSFTKIYTALEENNYLDDEGVMKSLTQELDPLNFSSEIKYHQPWFTGRKWVFDEIEKWLKAANSSRVFLLTGMPGIGKTAISTQLIQRFPEIVAFYLCKRGDSQKSSTQRAITTIAHQLSAQLPEYREILQAKNIENEMRRCTDSGSLFDVLIQQPLSAVHSETIKVILIDALDEATYNDNNDIADLIGCEFDRLPNWVKVIVTCRPNEACLDSLQEYNPWQLQPKSEDNNIDIRSYVYSRLKDKYSKEDIDKITELLIVKSEGTFLYVECMCDDIINGGVDNIYDNDTYPQGMGGYYLRYFKHKFPNKIDYHKDIAPALMVLSAAFDPLSRDEVMELARFSNTQMDNFLQKMGAYITVLSDGTLSPLHKSLFDWLDSDINSKNRPIYSLHLIDAHKLICDFEFEQSDYSRSYLLKFRARHAIESRDWSLFSSIYKLNEYMDERIEVLGQYSAINIYINDISELLRKSANEQKSTQLFIKKCIYSIYGSPEFIRVLNKCSSLMFDMEYYKILRKNRFEDYLAIIANINDLDIFYKQILINYYYINNEIGNVVKIEIDDIGFEISKEYSKDYLICQARATNMLGVCNRILGNFVSAIKYFTISTKIYNMLKLPDRESIVCGNLARVYLMVGNFEKTYEVLNYGISIMKLDTSDDEEVNIIDKLHQYNGCVHILGGVYLQDCKPDEAEKTLKLVGDLYATPKYRNRYWLRYIYSITVSSLLRGNIQSAKHVLTQIDDIQSAANNLHIQNVINLLMWIEGKLHKNVDLLVEAKENCSKQMLNLYNNSHFENFAEVYALYKHICIDLNCIDEMGCYEVKETIVTWGAFKFNWFSKIYNICSADNNL